MWEREDNEQYREINKSLRRIADVLEKLYKLAVKDEESQYQLLIIWKGPNEMATNDVSLNLTVPFGNNVGVPVETENGNPFTFTPANIQWAVQDATVASFVTNPDGTATFTPLKVGSTQVAVTDSSTGATATGTLTVTQTVANTFAMSINWTAPSGGAIGASPVKK